MTSPDGRLLKWDPAGGGTGTPDAAVTVVEEAPHGPLLRRHARTLRHDLRHGRRRHDRRRLVRAGSAGATRRTSTLGISPTSPARRASSTSSRRGRSSRRWRPATASCSGPRTRPTSASFSAFPTSTITSSSATTARHGRRRASVTTSSMTLWMSQQGLFSFDGTSIAADRLQGAAVGRRRHRPAQRARAGVRGPRRQFQRVLVVLPAARPALQHPLHHLQLQGGLVVAGADDALGRHHRLLHRADDHGRRPGRLRA